jgi:NADPH-dependent curcumin reductase CurA
MPSTLEFLEISAEDEPTRLIAGIKNSDVVWYFRDVVSFDRFRDLLQVGDQMQDEMIQAIPDIFENVAAEDAETVFTQMFSVERIEVGGNIAEVESTLLEDLSLYVDAFVDALGALLVA